MGLVFSSRHFASINFGLDLEVFGSIFLFPLITKSHSKTRSSVPRAGQNIAGGPLAPWPTMWVQIKLLSALTEAIQASHPNVPHPLQGQNPAAGSGSSSVT